MILKPLPGNVVMAIESERQHQEQKWPGNNHSVAEWLLIMEKLMGDARRAWVMGHGDNQALHEIRQVVATGVACMEQCGAPFRDDPVEGCKYPNVKTARELELEDLLISARTIVQRMGKDTAWHRFDAQLAKAGIGCVTAKVFKVLPSDG